MDFPLFAEEENKEKPFVYLDSAATSQKPYAVLKKARDYYKNINANPHRGSYLLSVKSTALYDETREALRRFFHVPADYEIVFTKNATESLNLVAYSYGLTHVEEGDEIIVSVSEHHSNFVPWQMVAKKKRAKLVILYCDKEGRLSADELAKKITSRTKIAAFTHASNVTGTIQPVKELTDLCHDRGVVAVVDGTQAAPHLPVDIASFTPDFYVGSGHKMLAPMGIGFLLARTSLLEAMEPFLYGGDMIEYVTEQETTYALVPQKFEAGTQNMGAVAGLLAAIEYMDELTFPRIKDHEEELTAYMLDRLHSLPYIRIAGRQECRGRLGVVSFTMDDVHPHDIATILDSERVAIRSGHHCAQPLHRFLGVQATARASIQVYNDKSDIDRLYDALKEVRRWMGLGNE